MLFMLLVRFTEYEKNLIASSLNKPNPRKVLSFFTDNPY